MWTPSHVLVNAFVGDRLKGRIRVHPTALIAGAVAPDVPLLALTFGLAAWRRVVGTALPGEGLYAPGFDDLFFRDPTWVAAHNAMHAPLVLLAIAALGWLGWRRHRAWGLPVAWFAIGCGIHSLIDILTHHRDGPLVWFPFDWTYRFRSAISYWQPEHFGGVAMAAELILDVALGLYLLGKWWRRQAEAATQPATRGPAPRPTIGYRRRA